MRISSGKNKGDWQVRDLPLVVCANNVSLNLLLRSIADTTHLAFTTEKVGSDKDDAYVYRVWLSGQLQREWNAYINGKSKAQKAIANWTWDALVAFGNVSDDDFSAPLGVYKRQADLVRLVSGIVQTLGQNAKDYVLNDGQRIDVKMSSCTNPEMFRRLYTLGKSISMPTNSPGAIVDVTDYELDDAVFSIFQSNNDPGEDYNVTYCMAPILEEKKENCVMSTYWSSSLRYELDNWWNKVKDRKVPSPPDDSSFKEPPDHMMASFVPLVDDPQSFDLDARHEWKSDALRANVHVELPDDRDVSFAQTLSAISKASGWTIVAENYIDQQRLWSQSLTFGSTNGHIVPLKAVKLDASMGDMLCRLGYPDGCSSKIDWYIDENAKIAIGRAHSWVTHHNNLMPESVLADLRDKANGSGIELDDLVKLAGFPSGANFEWISNSRDFYYLYTVAGGNSAEDVFWHFYNRLLPKDKALAMSDSGLPLLKYDIRWIRSFMASVRQANNRGIIIHSFSNPESKRQYEEKEDQYWAMLSNLNVVQSLVLHIKKIDLPSSFVDCMLDSHYMSLGSKQFLSYRVSDRHTYVAELDGVYQGEPVQMKFNSPYKSFPIYSPEREVELEKQRKEGGPNNTK